MCESGRPGALEPTHAVEAVERTLVSRRGAGVSEFQRHTVFDLPLHRHFLECGPGPTTSDSLQGSLQVYTLVPTPQACSHTVGPF